ncbi:hypothetical protein [Paenibacillus solani]|uniref:hypothetical protein n=1 Tax=Paenibacillus solani TaxID=1705565 RepID=UPI003D29F2D6
MAILVAAGNPSSCLHIRRTHQDARVPAAANIAGGHPGAAGNPSSCAGSGGRTRKVWPAATDVAGGHPGCCRQSEQLSAYPEDASGC